MVFKQHTGYPELALVFNDCRAFTFRQQRAMTSKDLEKFFPF